MTMIPLYKKCSQCSGDMKSDVYVCPSCGHEHIERVGLLLAIGIIFIPLIFSWFALKKGYSSRVKFLSMVWLAVTCLLMFSEMTTSTGNSNKPQDASIEDPQTTESGHSASSNNWDYSEEYDKMRSATSYWATATSQETKDFGFPYTNVQQKIVLRQRPSDGFNILIALSNGQYSCKYDGCDINVKFDNEQIQKYHVSKASDLTSGTIFIENKSSFLSKLRQSSKVMIESDIFQNGPQTFEFNVLGLAWDH